MKIDSMGYRPVSATKKEKDKARLAIESPDGTKYTIYGCASVVMLGNDIWIEYRDAEGGVISGMHLTEYNALYDLKRAIGMHIHYFSNREENTQ